MSLTATVAVLSAVATAHPASAQQRRGVEAERAELRGAVVSDPSASGGQAVKVRLGRRAAVLRAPLHPAPSVRVRLRGCGGTIRVSAGSGPFRAVRVGRSWQTVTVTTAAGGAASPVRFARPSSRSGRSCPRVSIDRIDVQAAPVVLGAATRDDLLTTAPGYEQAVASTFGGVTPENELKMAFTQPSPGVFDFARADRLVDFARGRRMPVRGHTLVYDQQLPQWVTQPLVPWTRERLLEVLRTHITTLVARYRGRVDTWDVVNEVLTPDGKLKPSIWQRVIGDDYIDLAFRFARAADPNAHLVINDVGVERPGLHQDGLARLVRDLRARGVPVDGVGFQAHIDQAGVPTASELDETLSRFARLGVTTEITEADVPLSPPVTAAALMRQQTIYGTLATACWEHASCTAFTVWGADDGHSWRGAQTRATLLDAQYRAKSSTALVMQHLSGRIP